MKRSFVAAALLLSGCTLVGGLGAAGITKAHNSSVDSEDTWSYLTPVVTGAAIGLIIDFIILRAAGNGLGSLAKQ